MGGTRKDYDDNFKMEVVRESLKKNAVDAEVAARYNISPSTLNEWKTAFFKNEIKSEAQKKLQKMETMKLRTKTEQLNEKL